MISSKSGQSRGKNSRKFSRYNVNLKSLRVIPVTPVNSSRESNWALFQSRFFRIPYYYWYKLSPVWSEEGCIFLTRSGKSTGQDRSRSRQVLVS